jgi:hexosaminidase
MTAALALGAHSGTELNIIPAPLKLVKGRGRMTVNQQTMVRYAEGARNEAESLAQWLRSSSGLPMRVQEVRGSASNCIDFVLSPGRDDLGKEGYWLQITRNRVRAEAKTSAGLFYAAVTLRQLLPAEAFSPKPMAGVKWSFPCLEITDMPRFEWRGMHLDVSRHFYPADFIKKYIDLLAVHKMNVFHWHLVDDGGWRLEIKKYPLLTQRGAWRSSPPKETWDYGKIVFPEKRDGTEYGGFYTQNDIRDIVQYAAQRHITIVPEIEMPGHTWPSISSYPELGCDLPAGYHPPSSMPGDNVYCAGKEEVFQFLEDVLTETMELFPSQYIHIGGDEVDKRFWNLCPKCKARMQAEGLKDPNELQSYFIRRIDRFLTAHGRKLIGWDEILEGGLAQGATVMSWRGTSGGIEAVGQGKHAIMSPTSHCYFDYAYSTTPTERVYQYEPVPPEIAEHPEMILGAQGNVWTEWMPDSTDVERMAYPRAAAMAEVTWSPQKGKDLGDFMHRLSAHYARLDYLDVRYRIPPPEAPSNAILFGKSTKVSFTPAPIRGLQLRYTIDGSQPTPQSPVYRNPIRIRSNADVEAAMFRADGAGSDVVVVSCRKREAIPPNQLLPGVTVSYYEGRWSRVPDFGALSSLRQQVVSSIDLSLRQRAEFYALRFMGYIRIPKNGTYTFTLSSDDGSWLRIGGATVVDHDGPHATSEKTGRVVLTAGVHPFELGYFQATGGSSLNLWLEGPGMPKQTVTGGMLFHDKDAKKE